MELDAARKAMAEKLARDERALTPEEKAREERFEALEARFFALGNVEHIGIEQDVFATKQTLCFYFPESQPGSEDDIHVNLRISYGTPPYSPLRFAGIEAKWWT